MSFMMACIKSTFGLMLIVSMLQRALTNDGDLSGICQIGHELKEYFSTRQICCEEGIHSRHRFMCCNEKLVEREVCSPDGSKCEERICCGSEIVSKEKHLCCNGNVISLNETQVTSKSDLMCCGKEYIRSDEQKWCCGGIPIDADQNFGCCGGEIYDKRKKCKNNQILESDESLCSGQKYKTTSAGCCGGKLNTEMSQLDPNFDCCDQEVMDRSKEKCCSKDEYIGFQSHKIPASDHLQCCGEGYFDNSNRTQHCINNTAITLGKHKERCGLSTIDARTHGCCENKISYDKKTQKCCSGSGYCVLGKEQECCNGYPLMSKEICCQGKRPCLKAAIDDDKCCYNFITRKGLTYKSKDNKLCVKGRLRSMEAGHISCGPRKYYDPSKQMCCGYNVYTRNDDYACCTETGLRYKIGEERSKEVSRKEKNKIKVKEESRSHSRVVCGLYKIKKTTKSCCGIFPYKTSSKHQKCCSDRELYNSRISTCTKDGRVQPRSRSRCYICRSRFFDGAVEAACFKRYAIVAKVTDVVVRVPKIHHDKLIVRMYLQGVRTLDRNNGLPLSVESDSPRIHDSPPIQAPNSLVIDIQTTNRNTCLKYYKKKSKRFMIFFDEPIRRRKVQFFEQSSIFITKSSRKRQKDVTRSITKEFCKQYR